MSKWAVGVEQLAGGQRERRTEALVNYSGFTRKRLGREFRATKARWAKFRAEQARSQIT